jgi:hypothetical protein
MAACTDRPGVGTTMVQSVQAAGGELAGLAVLTGFNTGSNIRPEWPIPVKAANGADGWYQAVALWFVHVLFKFKFDRLNLKTNCFLPFELQKIWTFFLKNQMSSPTPTL